MVRNPKKFLGRTRKQFHEKNNSQVKIETVPRHRHQPHEKVLPTELPGQNIEQEHIM